MVSLFRLIKGVERVGAELRTQVISSLHLLIWTSSEDLSTWCEGADHRTTTLPTVKQTSKTMPAPKETTTPMANTSSSSTVHEYSFDMGESSDSPMTVTIKVQSTEGSNMVSEKLSKVLFCTLCRSNPNLQQ